MADTVSSERALQEVRESAKENFSSENIRAITAQGTPELFAQYQRYAGSMGIPNPPPLYIAEVPDKARCEYGGMFVYDTETMQPFGILHSSRVLQPGGHLDEETVKHELGHYVRCSVLKDPVCKSGQLGALESEELFADYKMIQGLEKPMRYLEANRQIQELQWQQANAGTVQLDSKDLQQAVNRANQRISLYEIAQGVPSLCSALYLHPEEAQKISPEGLSALSPLCPPPMALPKTPPATAEKAAEKLCKTLKDKATRDIMDEISQGSVEAVAQVCPNAKWAKNLPKKEDGASR